MDGLTISNAEGLLETGKTLSEQRTSRINKEAGIPSASTEKSFADTLKDAVQNVNEMQQTADVAMQKLATGESKNIPEVMIATEKADIALKLMVQVRNKIIDAYHEVMKMQV
ncbi:MAG: flagellar hook-basal body complex protein FliE [Bdellovibrionales bacterium]|nr:flagellar hook-basal body complex protein FliE [Bdellovibrionales bacterium]